VKRPLTRRQAELSALVRLIGRLGSAGGFAVSTEGSTRRPTGNSMEGDVANGATVTSFEKAGTRTVRVDRRSVILEPGELLVYTVIARGAMPVFGFSCRDKEILSAASIAGHPREKYQWEFDPDSNDDVVMLLLSFIAVVKYSVQIDRISSAGLLIETVRDVDYESQDPDDTAEDSLGVRRRS